MPEKLPNVDPYEFMPDTAKTGVPHTPAPSAESGDDPYRDLGDSRKPLEGVKIVGTNATGQPIYAPASDPEGSPAGRFLSSASKKLMEMATGTYHGLIEGPQNPEEAAIEARNPFAGRGDLILHRFVTGPMKSEAAKTGEEFRQSDPWSLHPSEEALRHRQLALGHGLATVLPMMGPGAAEAGEQAGKQWAKGDVAGALGTGAGTVIPYAVPEAAGRVAGSEFVSKTVSRGMITKMIRPMAGDLKFGKDPVAAILDEGITGNTLEDIANKVSDKLADVGQQLNREAQKPANAAKVVDLKSALKPLDDAMAQATKAGDKNLFNKLLEVRGELSNNWRPFRNVSGQVTLRSIGPRNMRMSPYDALTFKRLVGDRVRWTQDPLEGATNKALGAVYGQIKDAVNDQVPGLAELNSKYSNLVGAAKSLERRIPVENRNAAWSLNDIVLAGSGHIPLAIARHAARSPAVRSRVAAGLYNLPRTVQQSPLKAIGPVSGAAESAQREKDWQALHDAHTQGQSEDERRAREMVKGMSEGYSRP